MNFSLKQSYRALKLIYASLISGLILFQLVTILMNDLAIPGIQEGFDVLNLVSAVLILMIPAGKMVSDRQVQTIDASAPLQSRFSKLQTAMIMRWAWIEGPAIFSIVVFLLLNDGKQLLLFLVCLVAFILAYPAKTKVADMLKLSEEEKREFHSFDSL
jgi:hypothetical protein